MLSVKGFEEKLHEAMRQKDEVAKNTYKILLSSIKMLEIEKSKALDETAILAILQKEIKMRRESIVEFQKGQRSDLIKFADAEIKILEQYLPKQLTDEEIKKAATEAIAEINASSATDMGKVMKILMPRLSGKASSERISIIVRSLLN